MVNFLNGKRLKWEDPFTLEKMNGVSGKTYSSTYFRIYFNTKAEGWKKSIKGTAIHEYGHTYFYEMIDKDYADVLWQYILDEALTQNLTEALAPEAPEPWRTEHSENKISEHWPEIKNNLNRDVNHPDPLYISKSENNSYPNWLGYSLSYIIGKRLLKEHELEEFPGLNKTDVVKAGDRLFA